MSFIRPFVLVIAAIGLSACTMTDPPSRGQTGPEFLITAPAVEGSYNIAKVVVSVPQSLVVSEENTYLPTADIVWRGEAMGNRYEQVRNIVQAALTRGTAGLDRGQRVALYATVSRFHALTDKTRATIGGRHNVQFDLVLRDLQTGQDIGPMRHVNASVRGAGGATALAEEAVGRTQKVVITEAIIAAIQKELAPKAGLFNGGLVSKSPRAPSNDLP